MMNRGLGEMFYGRRPVQYMQTGGLSGWGSMAAAGPVKTSPIKTSSAQVTREPAAYTSTRTTSTSPVREPAQVTQKPSSYESMQSRESRSSQRKDRDDLSRAIADSYAAEAMANAALASAAQYVDDFPSSSTGGGSGYSFGSTPVGGGMPAGASNVGVTSGVLPDSISRDGRPGGVGVSGVGGGFYEEPSAGLSRPAYEGVLSAGLGLSQPAYAGVSSVSPVVTQGTGTSAAPAAVTGTGTSTGAPVEGGGFFDGIGKFFSGMYNDLEMGLYLLTQGEEAFIEKYGADALADYRRRSAETAARTAAEEAARGDDSDVFEACPEGYERDPVTNVCVPVPVKLEEEEEEKETVTDTTPSSGETIQEVIDRITVMPTGNVLPNVNFFGLQQGTRRMADGGAVDYRAAARAEAEKFGLRPDMFERMILRESNFDPMARSRKGALGLAQVMPATARDPGFGVAPLMNPLDPNESLRFGAEYLSALLREFGGDEERALAAYNAGVGRVRAAGGVPDIAETRDYVDFILRGRGPVEAPPPRPADLGKKAGPSKAAVSRAVAALTPERRASVPVPPMPSRPSMSREERMSQLQGGMGGSDSLSRAVDSVLSSLMR